MHKAHTRPKDAPTVISLRRVTQLHFAPNTCVVETPLREENESDVTDHCTVEALQLPISPSSGDTLHVTRPLTLRLQTSPRFTSNCVVPSPAPHKPHRPLALAQAPAS